MSSKNSACSVYGMDAFYPGVHSLNDWISCVAGYSRELRKGKVSEVIIHRRNFPSDSAISRTSRLSVRERRESLRDSTVSRGGEVPPAQHCRFHRFCCCLALSRATRTRRVFGRGRYPAVSCSPCTGSELLPTHHSLRLAGSRLSTA